ETRTKRCTFICSPRSPTRQALTFRAPSTSKPSTSISARRFTVARFLITFSAHWRGLRSNFGALGRVMVRFLKRGHSLNRPAEQGNEIGDASGRQAHSLVMEIAGGNDSVAQVNINQGGRAGRSLEGHLKIPKSRLSREGGCRDGPPSDMELMKEKFAKLLLGEDMSGGGKGVSSALALSNAITNLAESFLTSCFLIFVASVFSEQRRLEPMPAERKARWRKEIDWLLSVTDHIVELVPSQQTSKDGSNMEVILEKKKKFAFKSINQVLKAAMAINAQVLMEMEIPEAYIESLPKFNGLIHNSTDLKMFMLLIVLSLDILIDEMISSRVFPNAMQNGRASLGDSIYRSITYDDFDPEEFLESMDLSTEHKVLDLKNRIEASIIIWMRKMHNKDTKSTWGSAVSMEKREQFEERAETILHLLKLQFPGIPQSALDTSKIQYSKIEDVLYADSLTQDPSLKDSSRRQLLTDSNLGAVKKLNPKEEMEKLKEAPNSMTLSDFMGWHFDPESETEMKNPGSLEEDTFSSQDMKKMKKPPDVVTTTKKFSYIEKLENLRCLRSPTARH
ncbi:hypothetical protein BHE74_00013393, partial [Ensete ventricosum]